MTLVFAQIYYFQKHGDVCNEAMLLYSIFFIVKVAWLYAIWINKWDFKLLKSKLFESVLNLFKLVLKPMNFTRFELLVLLLYVHVFIWSNDSPLEEKLASLVRYHTAADLDEQFSLYDETDESEFIQVDCFILSVLWATRYLC